jgi:hypothetical protein
VQATAATTTRAREKYKKPLVQRNFIGHSPFIRATKCEQDNAAGLHRALYHKARTRSSNFRATVMQMQLCAAQNRIANENDFAKYRV